MNLKINPILFFAFVGIFSVTLMVTLIVLGVPSYIGSTVVLFTALFAGIAFGKQSKKK